MPVGVRCFDNGRATINLADDAAPFLDGFLRRGYLIHTHSRREPSVLVIFDETLSHIVFLQVGKIWQVGHLRRSRVIAKVKHSFQGCEFAVDGGILCTW